MPSLTMVEGGAGYECGENCGKNGEDQRTAAVAHVCGWQAAQARDVGVRVGVARMGRVGGGWARRAKRLPIHRTSGQVRYGGDEVGTERSIEQARERKEKGDGVRGDS